jgi:hypothetical protein
MRGAGRRKQLFFEKRTKKLLGLRADTSCRAHGRLARHQTEKVFWFFFSKKNTFLPLPAFTRLPCNGRQAVETIRHLVLAARHCTPFPCDGH